MASLRLEHARLLLAFIGFRFVAFHYPVPIRSCQKRSLPRLVEVLTGTFIGFSGLPLVGECSMQWGVGWDEMGWD